MLSSPCLKKIKGLKCTIFPSFFQKLVFLSKSSDSTESACNAGGPGLIPGLGSSPGEGNGNPLQYSCLENSMDRGVHGVTKSQTWLSNWHTQTHTHRHTHTHIELLAYMFLRTKLMCSKWRKEGIQRVYMIKPIRNSLGLYLKDVPWSIYSSPLHGTPLVQATIHSHYCNLFCLCCLSLSLIIQTVARIAFSNIKPLHSFARDSLLTSHYT